MSASRRFIAGAVCPACGGVDKLFVVADDARMLCECVSCGFRDSRARDAAPGSAEYARGLGEAADGTQPVRFIDP